MAGFGEIALSVPRTRTWSALLVLRACAAWAANMDRMITTADPCFVLGVLTRQVALAPCPCLIAR